MWKGVIISWEGIKKLSIKKLEIEKKMIMVIMIMRIKMGNIIINNIKIYFLGNLNIFKKISPIQIKIRLKKRENGFILIFKEI
jgi:hypothetical protein